MSRESHVMHTHTPSITSANSALPMSSRGFIHYSSHTGPLKCTRHLSLPEALHQLKPCMGQRFITLQSSPQDAHMVTLLTFLESVQSILREPYHDHPQLWPPQGSISPPFSWH